MAAAPGPEGLLYSLSFKTDRISFRVPFHPMTIDSKLTFLSQSLFSSLPTLGWRGEGSCQGAGEVPGPALRTFKLVGPHGRPVEQV